ncbi:hypothetical protein D3C86_580910 [compost metagenome]
MTSPAAGEGPPPGGRLKRYKTLYFFGAGASAAEEPAAPTSADLLRGGLSRRQDQYQTLRKFLSGWGFVGDRQLPTIEELLSILDTCLSKGEPIRQAWSLSDLAKCREELVSCIYDYIGDTLDVQTNGHKERSLYRKLISQAPAESTSLISLNYDLLLDHALLQLGLQPDYALDFFEGHAPTSSRGTMRLYKLHGSLNWGYCPSCFSTVLTQDRRLRADEVCPNCEGPIRLLVIPPTPLKVPPSPFLSALWKKAEWELAQAKEIVFIGYSLSESDANIRYMLFRGFFASAPKVTVVLKEPPSDPASPVMGRYERLFPGGVEFFSSGFESYLQR